MPEPGKQAPTLAARPIRVLIAEDTPADAELIVAVLKRAGYALSFEIVDTPAQFKERIERTNFDLILSDHNLRTWTGMDALECLRKSGKEVPFIVVTATLGDEAAVEYIKQGAADYVLKNHLERLPTVVGRALREKAHREETARLQEEIFTAKKEWELTFDQVPDAVFLLDEDCHVRRANRAAAEALGLDFKQMIGRPCYEVIHGLREPRADCPHRQMLDTGEEARKDLVEQRLGKVFEVASSPLRDSAGGLRGCVVVMGDVTERRKLEEQFRQAQKMEAVGRLAGGIAHDFNNLLTIITGYSQLLLERLKSDDAQCGPVNEIKHAADRAAALTRQLLAFSRRQVLAPQVLDLNHVVANMDKMLRRLIGEDIELVTVCKEGLGRVKADPGQLEQVIMNLAVNSRDAMPRGGKLTIETANVELGEAYVRNHAAVNPGRYVMLAVSDTGHGMDAETQARIFEPFFTTKEQGKGTGLGLATVYGIVKQSGGNIWVYSEPGRGATFKIYFPRAEEVAKFVEPPPTRDSAPRGSETILLVEDEDAVRSLVRALLEPNGYKVLEARQAVEALSICERHKEPIHLLLTDVVMPTMSGRVLAARLAPVRPEMKVLFMSGYTDGAIVNHGVLEAGTAFLQKPFTPDSLGRKVREVLDQ